MAIEYTPIGCFLPFIFGYLSTMAIEKTRLGYWATGLICVGLIAASAYLYHDASSDYHHPAKQLTTAIAQVIPPFTLGSLAHFTKTSLSKFNNTYCK